MQDFATVFAREILAEFLNILPETAGVLAMTMIEVPDSQAAALKAKAALQGLTLKAWLGKLAEESPVDAPRKPLKYGR